MSLLYRWRGRSLVLTALALLAVLKGFCIMPIQAQVTPAAPAPGALIDTDFGGAARTMTEGSGKPNPKVSGVLPAGWSVDSAWADVSGRTEVIEEEGTKYLRVHAAQKVSGILQFAYHDFPPIREESLFRLTVRLRNHTNGTIGFAVREHGAPYRSAWSASDRFTRDFSTHVYNFRLAALDYPVGLWLYVNGTGTVDLKQVRLERVTRESLVAEMRAKYPDGGPANLLRNTRLPLGLQSGWSLDRDQSDGDVVRVSPDASQPGPSGVPSLKLEGEKVTVFMEPFAVANPVVPHSAGLRAKGTGTWTLTVSGSGDWARGASKQVTLTDSWQTVEAPFEPDVLSRMYQMRLSGGGTIWIDALRAGPASKAVQVAPGDGVEVALALPAAGGADDVSAARVQWDDAPARIRYAVTGKADGATLRARVANLYGESRELPPVRLGAGVVRQGEIDYAVFPAHPRGGYRIESWVERDGQRIGPVNELVVYRLQRPRYWGKDAPASPFGVHTNSTTRHNLMAKAVGINWVRLHDAGLQYIGWNSLEPKKGEWRFFDREIRRYRTHHLKINAELGTAPPWASAWGDVAEHRPNTYFAQFMQPKNLDDYRTYIETVVRRYRGDIDTWFPWNEPWHRNWWTVGYDPEKKEFVKGEHAIRDFAGLQKLAYETVKSIDPRATFVGINSTTGQPTAPGYFTGDAWTRGMLSFGALRTMDVADFHYYTNDPTGFPGDATEKGIGVAAAALRENGRFVKPLWMTEGQGALGSYGYGLYRYTVPGADGADGEAAADKTARYIVSLLARGVDKVFLYSMHSHSGGMWEIPQWITLVTPDGYLHPAGAAHAHLAAMLEDTRFLRTHEVAKDTYVHVFAGNGRVVAAIVARPGAAGYTLPATSAVAATDLWGNPVAPGTMLGRTVAYIAARSVADLEKAIGK